MIVNQKRHHATRSFRDEYLQFLKEYNIDFNSEYLFDWYPDGNETKRIQ
jgi:hypothetical protein